MRRLFFAIFLYPLAGIIPGFAAHAQTNPGGLKIIKDIPLPGSANRFDYQSINPTSRRLYISHMNSNAVVVFDLDRQSVIANIENIAGPTGILAVPGLGKVYVSASRTDEVVVIDERTLKILHRIPAGGFPDGIAFDPATRRVFVSDEHSRQVTVIDAQTDKPITNINMGGEVGNTHYNVTDRKIYSAVQTGDQLVCINPTDNKIIRRLALKDCKGPHGFYIDPATNYALITGESDGQFVALDLTSGNVVYRDKVGEDPDVLAFDPGQHRLYVSAESGTVAIFSIEKNSIKKLWQGFLAHHAHTVSVDPKTHIVYMPLEDVGGKPLLRLYKWP